MVIGFQTAWAYRPYHLVERAGYSSNSMSWEMCSLTGIAGVSPDPEVTERISVVYSASAGLGRTAGAGDNFHLKPFPAGTGGTPAIPVGKRSPCR